VLIAAAASGADSVVVYPSPLNLNSVTTPHFRTELTLSTNENAPVNVTIGDTRLQSPLGDSIPLLANPKSFALKKGAPQTVTLSAELLNATTYTGQLAITGLSAPYAITINRSATQLPITFSDVTVAEVTSTLPREELQVEIDATAYANGSDVTLPKPSLDSFTRRATSSMTATPALAKATLVGDQVLVKSNEKTPLKFTLTGIKLPGKYDGHIRYAPSGYQPIDKPFTIYVRDPFWIAMLWIFLGVFVSFVLYVYAGTIRPRLLAQQRITTLFLALRDDETRAAGDPQALALVRRVRDNIKREWDTNQQQRIATLGDIDAYERIVEAIAPWIGYRRQVATLRPVTVRKPLNAKLDEVAAQLGADHPDLMAVQTAITTLRDMPSEIRKAVSDELKRQLDDLKLQLQDIPAGTKIRDLVVAAASQLEHDDVEAAIESMQAARLEYAHYLAGVLLDRVSNKSGGARGMSAKDWASVRLATRTNAQKAKAATDPDEAIEWLIAAADPYVREVAAALQAAAMQNIADAGQQQGVLNAADAAVSTLAQSVAGALDKLDDAVKLYDKSTSPAAPMHAQMASFVATVFGALAGGPAGTTFDVGGIAGFGGAAEDLDRVGALASTRRQITTFDIAASIVVLIVACLVGMQTLWINDPAWGGPTSYLAAFVLGFGMDQFSKAGISALRR